MEEEQRAQSDCMAFYFNFNHREHGGGTEKTESCISFCFNAKGTEKAKTAQRILIRFY